MVNPLSLEPIWLNKRKFEEAERIFYEAKYGGNQQTNQQSNRRSGRTNKNAASNASNGSHIEFKSKASIELDKVRDYLKSSLSVSAKTLEYNERYNKLKKEKENLVRTIEDLRKSINKLELRINVVEKSGGKPAAATSSKPAESKPAPAKKDDDDDIDLFGSDEEDEEAEKAREERAQAAQAKKKPKPGVVAKSSVVLEIKPWDDETDLAKLEEAVRSVEMQGLLWGKSELKPVAFGVKKLQIVCVVEDDRVSIEELSEKIEAFEDYVQSVDVVAFNKI